MLADAQHEVVSLRRRDHLAEPAVLNGLIEAVSAHLPVSNHQYPTLGSTPASASHFCVRHSALHFSKTAGQLAGIAEALDHGQRLEQAQLRRIAANSLINTLKLVDEIGLTAEELLAEFERRLAPID